MKKWNKLETLLIHAGIFDIKYLKIPSNVQVNMLKPFLPGRSKDSIRNKIKRELAK